MKKTTKAVIGALINVHPPKYIAVDSWNGGYYSAKTKKAIKQYLDNDVAKSARDNYEVYEVMRMKL